MKRMIDASIWANEKFGELPQTARLLLIGMITIADDQGRVKGNSAWLRAQIFPYDDISSDDIVAALHQITANGTIHFYESDGKWYAQLVNWWDYQSLQYAQPSKYPKPSAWTDRIRYNYTKGAPLTFNWTLTDGSKSPDTCDEQGNPYAKPLRQDKEKVNNPPKNPGGYPGGDTNKDQDQEEDQDHSNRESVSHASEPPPPTLQETLNAAVNELERKQTLKLMASWEKGTRKDKQARVRLNPVQEAIVRSQPPATEIPDAGPATPLPPTVNPNRVISMPDGSKIIIEELIWTQMMNVMLIGLGKKELADAGVVRAKNDAARTLETLCKMSPRFRSKEGIQELFTSWTNSRPDYPVPKPEWLEEHAGLYLSGRVRYPGDNNGKFNGNERKNSEEHRDGGLPDRSATFDYFQWQADIAAGKFKNEPF